MSQIYFTRHGRGRPTVVLHGGLGLDHGYMRALDPLGDIAELVYVDIRGNGRSPHPPRWEDQTLATMADDLDAVCTQLGFKRWTVIGHSFGALIALVYAMRHPDQVAALLPIGGAAAFDHVPAVVDNVGKRDQPEAATALLAALGKPVDGDLRFAEVWNQILPLYFHRWDPRYRSAFADTRWSAAGYNRGSELLGTYDVRTELGRIAAPTLVVSGDDDFIMPVACGAEVARGIAGAQHVVLADSGHFPFLEQPATFEAAVRHWLATI